MLGIKIYRILTFILLPFAVYISLNVIGTLFMSMGNVGLLLLNFIIASVPVYIFTSSYFLFYGIFKAKGCKYGLKDWIKINGFISILFALLMGFISILLFLVFSNKALMTQFIAQLDSKQFPGAEFINKTQIIRMLKVFIAVMFPFSIILIVHIVFTFRAIKRYSHIFDEA